MKRGRGKRLRIAFPKARGGVGGQDLYDRSYARLGSDAVEMHRRGAGRGVGTSSWGIRWSYGPPPFLTPVLGTSCPWGGGTWGVPGA